MQLVKSFVRSHALVLAIFLGGLLIIPPALADTEPGGCNATGVGISFTVRRADGITPVGAGTATPGETLKYEVTLFWAGFLPGDIRNCAFEGGKISITPPNGVVTNVTPLGGIPCIGCDPGISFFTFAQVPYLVNGAHAVAGILNASTSYTDGTSHLGGDVFGIGVDSAIATPFQKLTPTLTTQVHNSNHQDITNQTVSVGTIIHDRAVVTGNATTTPTGTVSFDLFATSDCTGQPTIPTEIVAMDLVGVAHPTSNFTTTGAGPLSYKAHYNGDLNYNQADAQCEPLTVVESKIIVVKQTNPDLNPTVFSFTASYNVPGFMLSDGQSNNSGNLAPGSYSVSETVPAGWDPTSATCSDASSISAIGLELGETVTCTFTNTKRGHLVVQKTTNPALDPTVFSINATGTGQITGGGAGIVSDALDKDYEVTPGTYSVTETVPAGWEQTGNTCTGILVAAGGTQTCLMTNVKQAIVIVKKVMVGGVGTFTFTGTPSGAISINNGTIQQTVAPGQHLATETVPAGWNLTNISCNDNDSVGSTVNMNATFNVAAGETVTCTFTNTKKSTLTVNKVVRPGTDGGLFNLQIDGSTAGTGANLGNGGTTGAVEVSAAPHTVGETAGVGTNLANYVSVIDGHCDAAGHVTVGLGESKTCTITNTRKGTIIVEKQTDPDAAVGSFTFTGHAAGTISDGQQITVANLAPGTYTSTETNPLPAFALSSIACDDGGSATPSSGNLGTRTATFRLDPGETVKCTFTNAQPGQIAGMKFHDQNGNGIKDPLEPGLVGWTIYLDLNSNSVLDGGEPSQVTDILGNYLFPTLAPATYTVREVMKPGWAQTLPPAGPQIVVLVAGQSASGMDFGNQTASAPRDLKEQLVGDLIAARGATNNKRDINKLSHAIRDIQDSLNPRFWIDSSHLNPKRGHHVYLKEKDAVNDLRQLRDDKNNSTPDLLLQDLINRMVAIDRSLADMALNEAMAAGGDPKDLARAHEAMARADALAAAGRSENAMQRYRDAWKNAIDALP